jgi:hypothetical protein
MIKIKYTPEELCAFLKQVDYIWVCSPIRKWFLGSVVGWNICSSSLVRKKYTIERLQSEIDADDLPLEIKEENQFTNSFKVMIHEK